MGLETEVKRLQRQNRNLKLALMLIVIGFSMTVIATFSVAGFAAVRANAQAARAIEMERLARMQAEVARENAQIALQSAAQLRESQQ